MTSSELIKGILKEMKVEMRKIVREEIQRAMNPPQRKSEAQAISHGKSLVELTNDSEKKEELRHELRQNLKKKMVEFTKDPVLNKLLNETAAGKPPEKKIPTLGGKMFTSADVNSSVKPHIFERQVETPDIQEMLPEDRKHAQVPDFLEKALTRDYSELVNSKTFNKKINGG